MSLVLKAYKNIIKTVFEEAPWMLIFSMLAAMAYGLLQPLAVYVSSNIFNLGIAVADGRYSIFSYSVWLAAFLLVSIAPIMIKDIYIYTYVEMRAVLIYRTVFRKQMFEKMKKIKYEHYENEKTAEIIDRAFNRTEGSARHLYPMFFFNWIVGIVGSISTLLYLYSISWWLVLTTVIPFLVETLLMTNRRFSFFSEMDAYWKKDKSYFTLGEYLRNREYTQEQKLFGSASYLINLYRSRMASRNREYEGFFIRYLKANIMADSVTKVSKLINAGLILMLYIQQQINVGQFIALTTLILGSLYSLFGQCIGPIKSAGLQMRSMQYLNQLFELSEEDTGTVNTPPSNYQIEFKDIWFRYPGSTRDILCGVSFTLAEGERISLVGKNGEGKTTIVKLLLGLFRPDKGEILVGGRNLYDYSLAERVQLFGPVMQDFVRYQLTLRDNIRVGNISCMQDNERILNAACKAKVDDFADKLPAGYDTLLGREFSGGTDLSGGQWQRIAIARAFMGDKPILLLDEPTSQLDPIAETMVYSEFAEMAKGKSAMFITHRLASTQITDRILVLNRGRIEEEGSHDELMRIGGIYAEMFTTQKQYYEDDHVKARM